MRSGVYKLLNVVTGECYVGASADLQARRSTHETTLAAGTHDNPLLQASYVAHGREAFIFSALELCDPADVFKRETWWIDHLAPALNRTNKPRFSPKRAAEPRLIQATASGRLFFNAGLVMDRRKELGLTMRAAASSVGMSRQHWCNIESGRQRTLMVGNLYHVAEAIGVSPTELLVSVRP